MSVGCPQCDAQELISVTAFLDESGTRLEDDFFKAIPYHFAVQLGLRGCHEARKEPGVISPSGDRRIGEHVTSIRQPLNSGAHRSGHILPCTRILRPIS